MAENTVKDSEQEGFEEQGFEGQDPEKLSEDALLPAEEGAEEPEGGGGGSPYRNLWVPLFVVPAIVVMVLLAVFVFFGSIAGSEASIAQNLDRVRNGGSNERQQAVWNLAVQVAENQQANFSGRELPWPLEEGVREEARLALEELDDEEAEYRYVLAYLLHFLGSDEGFEELLELVRLDERLDSDGSLRFRAAQSLGAIGDSRAVPTLIGLLDHPDPGLRAAGAIGLQKMEGEGVREALRGSLGDDEFVVRANAALSLSHHGDPACADLLWELAGPEAYELERESQPTRFRSAEEVVRFRVLAVEGLGRLPDEARSERMDRLSQDTDVPIPVREAAIKARRAE